MYENIDEDENYQWSGKQICSVLLVLLGEGLLGNMYGQEYVKSFRNGLYVDYIFNWLYVQYNVNDLFMVFRY